MRQSIKLLLYGILIGIFIGSLATLVLSAKLLNLDWITIAAIATFAYSVTFLFSVVFIVIQIKEHQFSRDTEIMCLLYDRIIASVPKRRLIYENENCLVKINTLEKWDELQSKNQELADAVTIVSMDYHHMGLFIANGHLKDTKVFLSDIGHIYLRVYKIIVPIIKIQRERSGKTYREYLEYLKKEVEKA